MTSAAQPPNPPAPCSGDDDLRRRLERIEAERDEALRGQLVLEAQRDLAREVALRFEREAQQAREALARELGDALAGHAAALRSLAATFERRLAGREPSLAQLAALMTGATEGLLAALGSSLARIRPEPLGSGGLPAALRALLEDWRLRVPSMRFELLLEPSGDAAFGLADPATEEAALRIVAEALDNAVCHANAAMVVVSARRDGPMLVLQVSDDGRGLPGSPLAEGPGLATMHGLAARCGGRVLLATGESGGAELIAELRWS